MDAAGSYRPVFALSYSPAVRNWPPPGPTPTFLMWVVGRHNTVERWPDDHGCT